MRRMENEKKELRALRPKEKEFIHQIVYNGLSRAEAYALVSERKLTDETKASINSSATAMFFRPCVYAYYEDLMQEIREKDKDKAIWTREIATTKLMRLIDAAEKDLYGCPEEGLAPKQMTMSRINAVVLPVKELNLMNGYNNTNVNMGGGVVVKFEGEDEIPD